MHMSTPGFSLVARTSGTAGVVTQYETSRLRVPKYLSLVAWVKNRPEIVADRC